MQLAIQEHNHSGRAPRAHCSNNKEKIMGVHIDELPGDLKRKIAKKAGIQREQILKVAASIIKAAAESGESIVVQRKAIELALKWLKTR
jgi:hypothetical protein